MSFLEHLSRGDRPNPVAPAAALLARVLPRHAGHFDLLDTAPCEPIGDTLAAARQLHTRYRRLFR